MRQWGIREGVERGIEYYSHGCSIRGRGVEGLGMLYVAGHMVQVQEVGGGRNFAQCWNWLSSCPSRGCCRNIGCGFSQLHMLFNQLFHHPQAVGACPHGHSPLAFHHRSSTSRCSPKLDHRPPRPLSVLPHTASTMYEAWTTEHSRCPALHSSSKHLRFWSLAPPRIQKPSDFGATEDFCPPDTGCFCAVAPGGAIPALSVTLQSFHSLPLLHAIPPFSALPATNPPSFDLPTTGLSRRPRVGTPSL